jgi:DNA-binding FrmR family transcriptional regulator
MGVWSIAAMLDESTEAAVSLRLARIAGQVAGIQRMVEDKRYCVDLLLQIAAVQAALGGVARLVLDNHVRHCVTHAMHAGSEPDRNRKIAELIEVFEKFGHLRQRG